MYCQWQASGVKIFRLSDAGIATMLASGQLVPEREFGKSLPNAEFLGILVHDAL